LLALSFPVYAQSPAWVTLNREAYQLHKKGESEQAIKMCEKSIEQATESGDPLAVATATNTLGLIYLELEDYFQADPRFAKSLRLYSADPRMGPDAENTAKVAKNWAICLHELARDGEAEVQYRNALRIYQMFDANRNHPLTLNIVQGLAGTLVAQARYQEARELFREVVEKSEPDSLSVQQSRQGLAGIMSTLGEYDQAESLLLPIVKYYEDSDSPSVENFDRLARVLGYLGGVKLEQGDYRAAEEDYQRALRLKRRTSPNRPSLAAAVNNLALLYSEIGDVNQAEPLYREALAIHQKSLGPDHPLTATSLNNLGLLLSRKGDNEKAEEFLKRALGIERTSSGDDHPRVGKALMSLGVLYLSTKRPEEALPLFQEAVTISKNTGGPIYARALSNLGSAHDALGNLEEAEQSFQAVLEIGSPDSVYVAHNNLAYIYIDQDQPKKALFHARKASEVLFARLQNVFSFTSERQRLDFKRDLVPYGLLVTLDSPHDTFQAALRYKGAVLDSIVEDKQLAMAAGDPKFRELLDTIEVNKRELIQLQLEAGENDRMVSLRKAIERDEAKLARELTGFGEQRRLFKITPEQVQRKLSADTVLVEFIRHGYYLGKNASEKRYSALVVPSEGEVRLVPLGTADEIKKAVEDYRRQVLGLRSATRASRVVLGDSQAGRDPAALSALYDLVWRPVQKELSSSVTRVLLSPDGELNFVSFATLLDPQADFLAERYDISYLSSGRDLVTSSSSVDSEASQVRLFGNPEYGTHDPTVTGVVLSPLPGTAVECQALESALTTQSPVLVLGAQATEAEVRKLGSPRILHIATHGLFLSESLGPRNPMSRSGLAFVGAQTTLDGWAGGRASEPDQDGLLTAEEVGSMDLSNTELVVLSACDTGLGATENGEGVLGLRRGFVKSGARNLMFTLWPIDDAETARFMIEFYQRLDQESPSRALNQTQREWLVRLKKTEGAVTAARLAGPFVLNSVGGP
jgi:CHAT domain-containing protein/Flp pilus assembly protein TadD